MMPILAFGFARLVLDTHVWLRWVSDDERLTSAAGAVIETQQDDGLAISAKLRWEVAELVQLGRLELRHRTTDWLEDALAYPGCRLLELTPTSRTGSRTRRWCGGRGSRPGADPVRR